MRALIGAAGHNGADATLAVEGSNLLANPLGSVAKALELICRVYRDPKTASIGSAGGISKT
jgi:hypothetical protein